MKGALVPKHFSITMTIEEGRTLCLILDDALALSKTCREEGRSEWLMNEAEEELATAFINLLEQPR